MDEKSDILLNAKAIQAIPALSFSEGARAAFMREAFLSIGIEHVSSDDTGNVYAHIQGGALPPLILSAHLDCVISDPAPLKLEGTCLVGAGIGDNALGLATLLHLAEHYHANPSDLRGDLWLIANVCEEGLGNLQGIHKVVERFGGKVNAYIALEGIGLGTVQQGALGINRFKIEVSTKGGHAWNQFGCPSAIHEIVRLASQLGNLKLPSEPRTSLNIGMIDGGDSINTLASHAEMLVEIRSEEFETLKALSGIVNKTVIACNSNEVEVKISEIGTRPSGRLSQNHPLIQKAVKALKETGVRAVLVTSSTDASLPISLGYPATCLGITTGGAAHSKEEFIDLQMIQTGIRQITNLIKQVWET